MSFQFSVLLLQLRRKRNFVANANNFWVSSCSVKILDHTTECILLETNSQKKLCWWMHARDRPGLGGILAATWRRWPGRNLPGLCRGPLDTPHSGKIRQRTSLTVSYFCFLFSSHLCLCVCFRAKIKRFAMCVMRVRGAMTRWVHMWGMGTSWAIMLSPACVTPCQSVTRHRAEASSSSVTRETQSGDNPGLCVIFRIWDPNYSDTEHVHSALNALEKCLKGV